MGLFEGWAIISDIDSTLLSHGMMMVSDANKEAINLWRKEGGIFTFATGRYLGGALNVCQNLDVDLPFIYNNGSAIYLPAAQKYDSVLALGSGIFDILSDVKKHFPFCGIAGYNEETMFLIQEDTLLKKHFARQSLSPQYLQKEGALASFCKVLITTESSKMNELKSFLADKPYSNCYQFAQSTPEFFEITPRGATKGAQLPRLCELLNQSPQKIVTIGDNENDIDFLKASHISFAVANATDEAKRAAQNITQSRGPPGLRPAEIIKKLEDLIKKEQGNG